MGRGHNAFCLGPGCAADVAVVAVHPPKRLDGLQQLSVVRVCALGVYDPAFAVLTDELPTYIDPVNCTPLAYETRRSLLSVLTHCDQPLSSCTAGQCRALSLVWFSAAHCYSRTSTDA